MLCSQTYFQQIGKKTKVRCVIQLASTASHLFEQFAIPVKLCLLVPQFTSKVVALQVQNISNSAAHVCKIQSQMVCFWDSGLDGQGGKRSSKLSREFQQTWPVQKVVMYYMLVKFAKPHAINHHEPCSDDLNLTQLGQYW